MNELDFSRNFEDYSEYCIPKGVRIPIIEIDNDVKIEYGISDLKCPHDILRQLCRVGYKRKLIDSKENKQEYIDRINHELDVLKKLGFSQYIVAIFDLIVWADKNKIARGWGRGSLGGSLVAHLLGLTAIDPIKHGLIFERFINESRAQFKIIDGEQWTDGGSLPDADLDFSEMERDRVISDYLEVKYKNRISHISTITTLSSKIAIKEVCKKYGNFTEQESNRITNLVDSEAGTLDSLEETFEKNDQFKEWVKSHGDIYRIAKKLCDLPRNFGLHAAGIITSYEEIFDSLPLMYRADSKGGIRLVECYSKNDVAEEQQKLDILGISCLDIIYNTAKDVGFDLNSFDYEDKFIYENLKNLEHKYGLFQIEGDTGFRVIKKVKPDNFDEVSDILAIARPGALAFLEQYVEAKETGKIKSICPEIDKILVGTKGVILYQEDLMRAIHEVYGFSLLEADAIRKIVGKKLVDKVAEWEDKIKNAGKNKNIPEDATQLFWETVQASAKYSFNKSHSQNYAYISVLTTYLKFKYPAQFFKNSLISKPEKISEITKELPHFGVKLKPPDLIKSNDDFFVDGNDIRYGMKNIRGLQDKGLEKLKQFNSDQPNKFKLFESAKSSGIPISILKNLIRAGCLSSFGENRGRLVLEACTWNLLTDSQKSKIIKFGPKYNYDILDILVAMKDGKIRDGEKEIISTQKRKNGGNSPWDNFYAKYTPFKEEYEDYQGQAKFFDYYFEQDVLGFSYSSSLKSILAEKYDNVISVSEIENEEIDSTIIFGGIIQEAKIGKTKKGGKMLSLTMSDETGLVNVKMFNYATRDGEVNNVDELEKENGRLPEKGDVVVVRASKKDRVAFSDKIRILNLSYKK